MAVHKMRYVEAGRDSDVDLTSSCWTHLQYAQVANSGRSLFDDLTLHYALPSSLHFAFNSGLSSVSPSSFPPHPGERALLSKTFQPSPRFPSDEPRTASHQGLRTDRLLWQSACSFIGEEALVGPYLIACLSAHLESSHDLIPFLSSITLTVATSVKLQCGLLCLRIATSARINSSFVLK